jgi:hypothetical protein
MKKYILILCLFFLSIFGRSQNLVSNHSFENYTSCPTSGGQLYLASPWTALPTNDVEYVNACAPSCSGSVPCQNPVSFQYARTGNGMAGFWMLNSYGGNYREYLQVQLLDTLQASKCYYVKFYVNLYNIVGLAVNNFGVHFSNNSYSIISGIAPYSSQITQFENNIIRDSLNWHPIEGLYVASGNERFITIGNFSDDINTDTLHTGYGTYPGAYYYIDDVSILPIDSIPGGMPAFAGNDTNVVIVDSVFIGQEISNLNCNWYNAAGTLIASNISGIYVQPTSDTYYVVEQNLCGTITYDTVNVNVSGVGINENGWGTQINLYPNPNDGNLKLEFKDPENNPLSIEITDVAGKLVHTQKPKLTGGISDLALDLSNGIYMMHIINIKSQERIIKKLVIQK